MAADLTVLPDVGLDELEQLELTVDVGLGAALDALVELRRRRAHLARGFGLWHEYVLARFGEAISRLRLPEGERLALVESMCTPTVEHRRGMPVRAQAERLGVAVGTVQNDRVALGLAAPRPRPERLPAPAGRVWEQAAEYLRRAGGRGLTLVELARAAGWTEGKASGALTDVRRRGLAVRTEDRRAGQRVHRSVDSCDAVR